MDSLKHIFNQLKNIIGSEQYEKFISQMMCLSKHEILRNKYKEEKNERDNY